MKYQERWCCTVHYQQKYLLILLVKLGNSGVNCPTALELFLSLGADNISAVSIWFVNKFGMKILFDPKKMQWEKLPSCLILQNCHSVLQTLQEERPTISHKLIKSIKNNPSSNIFQKWAMAVSLWHPKNDHIILSRC